jgi:hypothetical protein
MSKEASLASILVHGPWDFQPYFDGLTPFVFGDYFLVQLSLT